MPTGPAVPTAADVARIAAQPDAVLRNVMITQGYHDLAHVAHERLRGGANWCAFGTWASRQAGRTIRREDLRDGLRARLGASPELAGLAERALAVAGSTAAVSTAGALVHTITRAVELDGVLDRAATAVALGNRKVFEEIAMQFALFLEAHATGSAEAMAVFLDAFRPGDPPDGEAYLRQAFEAYLEADTASPGARAQLIHYANLLIAVHEQVHVQPEIEAALNCVFDEDAMRDRLLAVLLPAVWRRIRYRVAAFFGRRPPLDVALDRLLAHVQREIRQLITANAMTLQLPGPVTVHLGRGLTGSHALSLVSITEPRLTALLQRIDPMPDTTAGGGARDWSVLEQRLHLVADLFRCHHDSTSLFDPPFSPAQVAHLRAGRLPDPPL